MTMRMGVKPEHLAVPNYVALAGLILRYGDFAPKK